MKQIYLLSALLFSTLFAQAQIVNIPDANFKAKLLAANSNNAIAVNLNGGYFDIDTNNDNEIQLNEALQVKKLNISSASISNISGITSFANLEFLDFSSNQVTSFDLHGLSNLTFLTCSGNALGTLDMTYLLSLKNLQAAQCQLTSININGLPNLETLQCGYNQLTSLNLSGLPHLISIECNNNALPSLNVNLLTTLHNINCKYNNLSSLDVSNLTNLENLQFGYNHLTSIDITHNPEIYSLDCSYNQLTTIDVSHQPKLQYSSFMGNLYTELDFSNVDGYIYGSIHEYGIYDCPNLTYVNMKNGRQDYIHFGSPNNCPNLHFICVDDLNIQTIAMAIQQAGISNLQINTYCSFVPGGNYNTIAGHITIDTDNNGCDANDTYFPNIRINITNGPNTGAAFTDVSGNYAFYNNGGNFTITPVIPNTYFAITPPLATVNFPEALNLTQTQNFCITPIDQKNDVDIVIIPTSRCRPGFDCTFTLVYRNKGNQLMSGSIDLIYDDTILDLTAASPVIDNQSSGNLNWNYSNLMPFESRSIDFTLNLNGPTEIPSVNIGDILHFTATINPITGDETPADNVSSIDQIVRGSFDPNEKVCLEGTTISTQKIGDYLNYVIYFQNTGTDMAQNIVVKDVIDTTKLELNSLQFLSASHPQKTRIYNNNVEFIFENINLPAQIDNEPASHGFVAFKIKTKNNLILGNQVQNTANIYFDFNAPVVTNTTSTTVSLLNINEAEANGVSMSPIPVKNILQVKALDNITSVEVFDIQGRLLQVVKADDLSTTVDFTGKSKGIYLVKVYTSKGMKVQKIIKE